MNRGTASLHLLGIPGDSIKVNYPGFDIQRGVCSIHEGQLKVREPVHDGIDDELCLTIFTGTKLNKSSALLKHAHGWPIIHGIPGRTFVLTPCLYHCTYIALTVGKNDNVKVLQAVDIEQRNLWLYGINTLRDTSRDDLSGDGDGEHTQESVKAEYKMQRDRQTTDIVDFHIENKEQEASECSGNSSDDESDSESDKDNSIDHAAGKGCGKFEEERINSNNGSERKDNDKNYQSTTDALNPCDTSSTEDTSVFGHKDEGTPLVLIEPVTDVNMDFDELAIRRRRR